MITKYFLQFFKYFPEEKKPFLCYSILSVIAAILELFGVVLTYPFIIKILENNSAGDWRTSPIFIGSVIILLFLLKNLFMTLYLKIQIRYTNNFEIKLKSRFMRYFLGESYQSTSKISLAEKNKILNFLVPNVMNNFIFRLLNLNVNFFIFVLITVCLFVKFPLAAISATVMGVFLLLVQTRIYKPYLNKISKKLSELNLIFNKASNDALLNIKAVKISNNEKYFYDNFRNSLKNYCTISQKISFLNLVPPYITEPVAIIILFVLIVIISAQNYGNPQTLVASLALIGAAIFRLTPAVSRIQVNLNGINSVIPIVEEFIDIYERLSINKVPDITKKDFTEFEDNIELKNVSFSYNEEKEVLKNINLKINKGEFIGIAGISGAGKTTLVDIIAGLYKPNNGEILIDGKVSSKLLKIGYVPQEFVLINGNIKDNVIFGSSNENDDRVVEALKKAQLYDYIAANYTEGIYANPFVDSTGLSQGQKQRLAIARALYSEPDLLIMDEATSSLDLKTEDEICHVLNELKGNTTIIVIAHRLSTIKSADRIVFMQNGKVDAIGTLNELSQKSEQFNKLIEIYKNN